MRSFTVILLLVSVRQVQVQTVARPAMPQWQSVLNLPRAHKLPSNQNLNQPVLSPLPPTSNPERSPSLQAILNFNPLQHLFPQSRTSSHLETLRLPSRKKRDLVKVYGIDHHYGECRQATIPGNYEALFVSVASLRRGSCYSHGFVDAVATETFNAPFLGQIPIEVFQKVDSKGTSRSTLSIQAASQAFPNVIISAVLLSSLFAGSIGVIFAMLRFRSSTSTVDEEPLLAARI